MKFPLGQTVATPGALEALQEAGQSASEFLRRHSRGDWGCVGKDDAQLNDLAVNDESRVFSAYMTKAEKKLWIITEADRSATTILTPDEY